MVIPMTSQDYRAILTKALAGKNKHDIAERSGIAHETIGRWINGSQSAQILNVEVHFKMKLTIEKSACCKYYLWSRGDIHMYFDEVAVKDDMVMLCMEGFLIGILFGEEVNDFKAAWSVYE